MQSTRSSSRLLAILASGALAFTLSIGAASAYPCANCEPDDPGDGGGGNPTCGIAATADPTISTAQPRVGSTATGTRGTWSGSPTTFYYQWMSDGKPILSAGSLTSPALPGATYNKPLVLRVQATKSGCAIATDYSAPKTVALGLSSTNVSMPVMSPTAPRVGEPVSVTTGTWNPQPDSYGYRWLANGVTIPGADSAVFTPGPEHLRTSISVIVSAKRLGHADGSVQQFPTHDVALGAAPVATVAPRLMGAPEVGVPVQVSAGTWSLPATTSVQWFLDNLSIPGATGTSYTPTASQAGKKLSALFTATRAGHLPGSATAAAVVVKATPIVWATAPTVTGKRLFGSTVTVSPGTFTSAPDRVAHQWLRNGAAIKGATGVRYKLGVADVGRTISVRSTAIKAFADSQVRTASLGKAVAAPARWTGSRPVLKGKPKVNRVLKSSLGRTTLLRRMHPDATRVKYQWLRAGKAIAKATSASYRVRKADRRKVVALRITLTRPGYRPVYVVAAKRIR